MRRSRNITSVHISNHGFTLIEVLVAVLLLSVGVLGLVGLENLSLKNNNSAYHRSQATLLAYDLADRVRANVAGKDYYIDDFASASSNIVCPCTPQQRARKDLGEWIDRLTGILPDASAALVSGSSDEITISVIWNDHREKDPGAQFETFKTTFRP